MPIVGQQAPSGGGSSNNNIQLILGLAQLQAQKEEAAQRNAIAQNQQRIDGLSALTNIARNTTDPTQLTSLARIGAKNGLGDENDITFLLSHIAPTPDAARYGMSVQGINTQNGLGQLLYGDQAPSVNALANETASTFYTGEGRGTVAQQSTTEKSLNDFETNTPHIDRSKLSAIYGTEQTTGMDPDKLALSLAGANLPHDQQVARAQIAGGLRMSAGQEAQTQVGFAGVRSEDRYRTGQLGIAQANLDLDALKTKQAKGGTPPSVAALLEQQTQILKQIQDGGAALSTNDIKQRLAVLSQINVGLSSQGYPTIPIINGADGLPDPKQVFSPSFSGYISAWLSRK